MRASGQLTEVRIGDLRLGRAQSVEFLQRTTGKPISMETANRLFEKIEGWPAGLRLTALALRRRSDVEAFLEGVDGGFIHSQQYMVGEVLARQPPENQLPPAVAHTPGPLHRARCECRRCGVHMITDVGFKVAGSCRNCGSFELVPIADL